MHYVNVVVRGAFETVVDESRLCVPVHYVNVVVRGAFETVVDESVGLTSRRVERWRIYAVERG